MIDLSIAANPPAGTPSAFSVRLDTALAALGMSNAQLAQALDPSNGGQLIYGWRRRGSLAAESRNRLRPHLPGISLDWLLDGVGEMWLATSSELTAMNSMVRDTHATYLRPIAIWDNPRDLPPETTVLLQKLDYHLSAGHGGPGPNSFERTDRVMPFRADFAAANGWTQRTHYTMRCSGESMVPTIQDGAPVVIATNDRAIKSGRIYAILLAGEPLLKRLDRLPGGKLRARSDNPSPAYAAFEVDESALEIIGRAVWTPVML